jgi:uncharacterized membrane protein
MRLRPPRFDAHHRLLVALAIAVIVFLSFHRHSIELRAIAAWNAFAGTAVILAWTRMLLFDARASAQETRLQDSNRTAIFLFVIFAAVASLLAVGWLLTSAKPAHAQTSSPILLASATVVLSWSLIHTTFALHYAHVYYQRSGTNGKPSHGGGLLFPDEQHPGFLDFAYFSFVIGMTCQVSDVQISSKRLRRLALLHGALAFGFNTIILALTINLASTLLTR